MKKRLLKAAILSALALSLAAPAFASPLTDVPANHWAYKAVNQLVSAGIVDGYGDGTFKGDKVVTRYEMAQIVSKAMGKSLNNDQKVVVDKLAREFSTELISMGVKLDGMQQQMDNMVKLSGDARMRYFSTKSDSDITDYRVRLGVAGKINNDMNFAARLSSGNANVENGANNIVLDTANVTFNTLGFATTVGRQDITPGSGFIMDTQMNGISSNIGAVKLFAGNVSNGGLNRVYGAEYGVNIMGSKLTADYVKNTTTDDQYYGANAAFRVTNGMTANVDYVKNDNNSAVAKAYGVKFNNIGLSATYRDVDANAMTALSTLYTGDNFSNSMLNGFKGMEYQYDKDLGKNATVTVKYQDFKDRNDNKLDGRTSASVNFKF